MSGLNEMMYIEYLTQWHTHNNSSTNNLSSLSSVRNTQRYFTIVHSIIAQWSHMVFGSNHGLTS